MKYVGKDGLIINGSEVWHEGNFNPNDKLDKEEFDNLEIGGRNLILSSDDEVDITDEDVIETTADGDFEVVGDEWGRNLIIRATETPNTWIPLNGIVSPHNNHATSDYIAVIPNQTYAFSKINSESATDYPGYFRWAWYDEEKNYISRQPNSDNEFLWEVPNGAYFVRISYPDDSFPKFEKGSVATPWSPAPEDYNTLKGKQYNLSTSLKKDQYYTISVEGSFEGEDFVGAWLGTDKFIGYLQEGKMTFKANENYGDTSIILKSLSEEGIISLVKLERGNKATDWTPAPEDIQAEIDKKADKTELPTKLSQLTKDINFDERYYTETEVNTKLDGKVDNSRVLTDVPANAKFTDTITTINGKTGAIAKADIVALGIPAQDTVYTHPANHPASMITESTTKRFVSDTEKANWNGKAEISDIPTKVGQLENDKLYVTQAELGSAGYGDMVKCYNVDTDILTDRGFINITQLNKQDKVATLNPSNDEIVYQPVKNIYKYNNIDKLYEISNQQIDLSVTLNHKMYIRKRNKDSFELVEAKDIMGKRVEYKKYGIWKGDYKPYVEIEDVKIPIEIYAEFMGYYLSEGCTINAINGQGVKDYLICITQVKSKTKEKMLKTTEQVAFLFGRNAFVNNGKNIKISDKRLYNHLHPFGKSYEKYIPDVIMNSTQEIIRIFLEAYVDGDGNRKNDCNRKTEQWSIFTTSKKMADQLQELALKAGWSANISEINKIGDISYINGRKVISRHTCYRIGFNKKKNTPMVNHGHTKKQNAQRESIVEYGGTVIGVEVEKYHTLYVRRNGKGVWSGNSTYDTNNNGKVDIAEVAETVIGNEIQLGGRFKLVYNDIEDSLDFEVI